MRTDYSELAIHLRDGGHSCEHRRHMLRTVTVNRIGITSADSEIPTGPDDLSTRAEELAYRRRKQVDLQFHRQHAHLRSHEGERRVAARTIEDSDADTRMEEIVLLGQPLCERHADLDHSRFDTFQPGAIPSRPCRAKLSRTRCS